MSGAISVRLCIAGLRISLKRAPEYGDLMGPSASLRGFSFASLALRIDGLEHSSTAVFDFLRDVG
jgi:hypothetical protein